MSKTTGPPYPGARPFSEPDRDRFFGRGTEAAVIAEWWLNNRLTFVVGKAGSGKTSLLRAGARPLLMDMRLAVLPVGRLSFGATFPSAALPAHNPYTLALLRSWAPAETTTRLVGLTVQEFIEHRPGNGIVLAAIDQADELLTDASPHRAHRRRFLAELKEALGKEPRLHLLVAGREEAIGVAMEVLGNGARYNVAGLTWQEAVEAVSRPVVGFGRAFSDGAAETLVMDLQTSRIAGDDAAGHCVTDDYVEPTLLQVACTQLWDSLPAHVDLITPQDVRKYADVDTALAAYCGSVVSKIADEHDIPAKRVRAWLLRTFITELGTRGRAYEGTTATAGMPNAIARALEDRHLLSAGPESGSRWYGLLSDRLIEPLRHASDVRPSGEPDDYLRAAEHALTLGELDLAERYAEEILRASLGPGPRLRARAHSLLGNVAYELEKPEEALAHYREAARLYGAIEDNKAVAYQLAAIGHTLQAQGHVSEAVEELHAAVSRLPNDLVLQTELAQALWQDGKGFAAVAILNDVLRMDGSNRAALLARGEILAYLGEARQAMLDLDRVALQGRPSTRAARGLALAELGDQSAARREIEDAVAEGRRNGPALLYAARAFALGGDDSAAHEFARQAANASDPPLSPRHREVAQELIGRWSG